jgi:hypothetical protein
LEELVFAGVHAVEVFGGEVVVALDVEEGVEGVEEEFVVYGVMEVVGAAAGFVEADDGVEIEEGAGEFEICDLRFETFCGRVAQVEGEDVGGGGEVHGAGVEGGHLGVADDGDGPIAGGEVEEFEELAQVGGEVGEAFGEDLEVDGHGDDYTGSWFAQPSLTLRVPFRRV